MRFKFDQLTVRSDPFGIYFDSRTRDEILFLALDAWMTKAGTLTTNWHHDEKHPVLFYVGIHEGTEDFKWELLYSFSPTATAAEVGDWIEDNLELIMEKVK